MNPLISIVVPIYKVEKYLSRCVDSIIGQTYDNLEIILVDDGSPDRCGEICDEYGLQDNRVVVIHKENGGLSDARNFGIERASGELISFVDSDDWLHTDFIARLYSLMIENDADIAASDFLKVYDHTSTIEKTEIEYSVLEFTNIESLEELEEDLGVQMVVAWGKLYKRELFKEVRYPRGKLHEDEFTTHKLLYLANKIVFTHEPLIFYFQRNDSITGQGFDIRKKLDFMDAMYERAGFLKVKGLDRLSDITYRVYFFAALANILYLQDHHDQQRVNEILGKRQSILADFRSGMHSKKFRLFVELYCLAPQMCLLFYKMFPGYLGSRR